MLDAFDVAERVAVLELDLDRAARPASPRWRRGSRPAGIPSSDLDLAFVVPDDVAAEKVEKAIRQAAGALLVDLDLFDVYRGEALGDGRRSLAYRLRLQAPDRTLTDADIAEPCAAAPWPPATKLGAELRG